MNIRQHISNHLERMIDALLPGGIWQVGRFLVKPCPAGRVAFYAMPQQVMCHRAPMRGKRSA